MVASISSHSDSGSYSDIDYKKVLKYSSLAAISILGTTILAATVVATIVLAGFAFSLLTVEGGLNAFLMLTIAANAGFAAWKVGLIAKEYCLKAHYAVNA